MLKKGDIILFFAVIIAAICLIFFNITRKSGSKICIYKETELIAELPIGENTRYDLSTNVLVIENGKAYMESANCPDKVCVNTGSISKKGETIVCLPNKIIVQVE